MLKSVVLSCLARMPTVPKSLMFSQTDKQSAWCPWVRVLTRPWIWQTFSMKNTSALHHLKMSFVSECDISTLIYHFITHSLKGQQPKRSFAFQLTGTSIKVLKVCIQHWKQDSLLGLSVSFSTSNCKMLATNLYRGKRLKGSVGQPISQS